MTTSITVKDAAGVNHTVYANPGYDVDDDMIKVKSIQKKFRDSFTRPLTDLWDITSGGGATATNVAGELTIASGTTAGGFVEMLSKETFTIPFRTMASVLNTRHASNHQIIEAVSVDPITGVPDGRHSVSMDIGGAASVTATQMVYTTQNGGLRPLSSVASAILTTAAYSILELEPFSDEAYFHSRAADSTAGRSTSYVRHQQIPDPTAIFKLRLASLNAGAWKNITGAVVGTANAIRLTITAHASTGSMWIDTLNGVTNAGAEVRGFYPITVVDANTVELTGTTFAGAYAQGSGRAALAAAPTAVSLKMQFINCQDYAELTAEITAGRGQSVEGQAIGARLVAGTAAIGSVTVASGVVTSVTAANLGLPTAVADVASAALTTTTTTAALIPTFGTCYSVAVPVTAVTGTLPTLDIGVEESDDTGVNWFRVYDFPRITAVGMYRSPKLPLTGNRVRYVQTVGGTTPSFTRTVNRLQSSDDVTYLRQIIDRSVVLTTLNSVTPSLVVQNCRNAKLSVNLGAATTPPALQLEGSEDNGQTWVALGAALSGAASSTVDLVVSNINYQLLRARVSTAGVTVTPGYVLLKGF